MQWTCNWPEAKSQTFTLYQGETATFQPTFRAYGIPVTNATIEAVWYTTNFVGTTGSPSVASGEGWWKLDNATFAPSNDVGAASYRFFVQASVPSPNPNNPNNQTISYRANGTLRMLPSPGFVPNVVEPPVVALDFAAIEVANAPWLLPDATNALSAALSPRIDAAASAATNYADSVATLNPRYSDSATFSEWTLKGDSRRIDDIWFDDGQWTILLSDGVGLENFYCTAPEDSTILNLGYGKTVTRTRTDVIPGYVLGSQTDKPLASEAEAEALRDAVAGKQAALSAAQLANIAAVPTVAQSATNYTDAATGEMIARLYGDEGELRAQYFGAETLYGVGKIVTQTGGIHGIPVRSYTNYLPAASGTLATEESLSSATNYLLSSAFAYTDAAADTLYPNASGQTLAAQVAAIGAALNGEDARFVVTNYDSVVHTPEAYVEVQVSNNWLRVWREGARWDKHEAETYAWKTNIESEVSQKADRAWGAYDSETGGYSPDGFTQISSSNILIAAGMAYQRTATSGGAVWVLQCNSGCAVLSGDTNGFFRVEDADGNAQFEIVKGNRQEMGADADGITVDGSTNPATLTIPYSIVADEHPTIQVSASLRPANWKAETDGDCAANVSWSGSSGAYVATVQAKSASATRLFVRATYEAGGETYIRNAAPAKFEGGILCTDGIHKVRPVYNNGSITWEVVQ